VGHLRATCRVAAATDQWIELWWRYFVIAATVDLPRGARALVSLQMRAGLGQLVEDGDSLQLRLTLPARELAPPALDHLLHAMAQEATRLSAAPRRWPSGGYAGARV